MLIVRSWTIGRMPNYQLPADTAFALSPRYETAQSRAEDLHLSRKGPVRRIRHPPSESSWLIDHPSNLTVTLELRVHGSE